MESGSSMRGMSLMCDPDSGEGNGKCGCSIGCFVGLEIYSVYEKRIGCGIKYGILDFFQQES